RCDLYLDRIEVSPNRADTPIIVGERGDWWGWWGDWQGDSPWTRRRSSRSWLTEPSGCRDTFDWPIFPIQSLSTGCKVEDEEICLRNVVIRWVWRMRTRRWSIGR